MVILKATFLVVFLTMAILTLAIMVAYTILNGLVTLMAKVAKATLVALILMAMRFLFI